MSMMGGAGAGAGGAEGGGSMGGMKSLGDVIGIAKQKKEEDMEHDMKKSRLAQLFGGMRMVAQ